LHLKNVPPFGFTSFKVVPGKNRSKKKPTVIAKVKNKLPFLENDLLSVKINANGTLSITDKKNKSSFKEVGYFFDEGEAGHAWVHTPVGPFADTLKSKAKISLIENGPLTAVVSIKHTMKLPADLKERAKRPKRFGIVEIELLVTMNKDSRRVDLKVNVNNTVESHRLRMMFPTSLKAEFSYGEGQFDVVKRTLDRPDTKDWIEQPMYDFPMHHFVDITDGKRGAAVLVNGLKEYEVLNDKKKTLAVTLFRSFEFIIAPSSRQDYTYQKGSQCLGWQSFELSFYPHNGDWNKGNVYHEAFDFNNALRLVQTGRTDGELPSSASFITIEPKQLMFSAVKRPENAEKDQYVLRLYNPTETDISGTISTLLPIADASLLTLEEKVVSSISLKDKRSVPVHVGPKKIITILLQFSTK
ncbi:MAG: glycoside hydrolase family 38 C-terminal domain-containing protein, partial [Bacteroidota bacterium]